ncbi:uncharacterized protein [Spinacia oleracea]|uniref:Uncharacterized protein n=1 Tax=Spinacia oleracea TaxID=3562 RepID=A0A9R0IK11_SPIOL|nr:uncharacterized protein LOC110789306 [Spinacia oleracea]
MSVKSSCLSFYVSLQECFGYCKAFVVGQGKRLMARNEKEATTADLQTAKMQVEAADDADEKKMHIHNSN